MKNILFLMSLWLCVTCGFAQEKMTPEQFRKLVATAGDTTPLVPQLARIPLWTNATVDIVLTYTSGKVFKEETPLTAKTIGGRYIVYTIQSKYYQQPMSSILTFDEKAPALKNYGLFGEVATESLIMYDFDKKITASTSTYADDYKEIGLGSYSTSESSDRTLVYKAGVLIMTRESTCHPVTSNK